MKKTLTLFALIFLALATTALADTVSVTSTTSFSDPGGQSISSTGSLGFQGTVTITFKVAGKTCNLKGSAGGPVPTGCNYAITVAPDGSISGTLVSGNQVCTQSKDIAASCK